jgi:abequosyltransferase
MDNMSPIYLTIAIPTFNRSSALDLSLASLTSQKIFSHSNCVQIIVSDNCSTDNTQIVCEKYLEKYPGKFFYYKNTSNIGDKNFEKSLSYGTGQFLKLSNDSLCYENGSLKHMVDLVKKNVIEKPTLFFLNGVFEKFSYTYSAKNLDDFLTKVSFYITCIACFGIWKRDFDSLPNFNRYSNLYLTQVDVLLRLLSVPNNYSIVDNTKIFDVQDVGDKGGYGLITVFVKNYFFLLEQFSISRKIINNEKRKVLLRHVVIFDAESAFKHSFVKENRCQIIWDHSRNNRFLFFLYYIYYIRWYLRFFLKYYRNIKC